MQGANKRRPARGGDERIAKRRSRGSALCLLLFVLVIWLVPVGLRAEVRLELQYAFDRFAAFSELASARVNTVVDDEDGTIWIGTQDGLFQFDGPSGVAVPSLLEAEDGGIWAGTADADLYRLTPEGETLARYGAVSDRGILSTPDVWDLELDSESGRFESLAGWSEALGGSQTHVLDAGSDGWWFSSLESGVVHCPHGGRDCRRLIHDAPFRFSGLDDSQPEIWALARRALSRNLRAGVLAGRLAGADDGDFTANPVWEEVNGDDKPGLVQIEDGELHIFRDNAPGNDCWDSPS